MSLVIQSTWEEKPTVIVEKDQKKIQSSWYLIINSQEDNSYGCPRGFTLGIAYI